MIPKTIEHYYRVHSKLYDATRWAFLFGRNSLKKYFPACTNQTHILDLGCGTGKHLGQLRNKYPTADIIGLDLSENMLGFIDHSVANSVELKNEFYTQNSFSENEFDLILCSYSLTMMSDVKGTLNAISVHLKPNGTLLLVDFDSTPFPWFQNWMKKNHVSFEPNLFRLLNNQFETKLIATKKAWFGLYSYSIFLAINLSRFAIPIESNSLRFSLNTAL